MEIQSMNVLSRLFLGKWWHWLLLLVFTGLLWQAGQAKMHVIYFNWFLMGLLAATIVGVVVLIYGTPAGAQITRDKLQDSEEGSMPDRE